jgi:hypothetical protein
MRMKYEMLIRRAFDNCGRWGDPLKLANADTYDGAIIEQKHRLKFGVSYAIQKLMADSEEDLYDALSELNDQIWEAGDQQEVNRIINRAHEIADVIYR